MWSGKLLKYVNRHIISYTTQWHRSIISGYIYEVWKNIPPWKLVTLDREAEVCWVWAELLKKSHSPLSVLWWRNFSGKKTVVAISLQKLEPVVLLIDKTTVSEFIQSLTENLSISLASRQQKCFRVRHILHFFTHPSLLTRLLLCSHSLRCSERMIKKYKLNSKFFSCNIRVP